MSDISQEKIFSAFSEKGREFVFPVKPKNWLDKILQSSGLKPKEKVLQVTPIKLGVRAICSTYINKATFDKYSKNSVFKAGSLFSENELDNVILFLAYVLWNREDKPPLWLIEGIRSLDQAKIDEIINFAHESLDTESFINSIISMTGVSLQPEEIIAPEKDSRGLIR